MKASEDRSYRRGAVVGLTTAELFMLTSFMLITALLLTEASILPDGGGGVDAMADMEGAPRPNPGVVGADERLAALEIEVERLTSESAHLAKELTDTRKEIDEKQGDLRQARARVKEEERRRKQAEADADEAHAAKEEAERAATEANDRLAALEIEVERLTSESAHLAKELTDTRKEIDEKQGDLRQARARVKEEERRRKQAEADADEAHAAKEEAERAATETNDRLAEGSGEDEERMRQIVAALEGLTRNAKEAEGRARAAERRAEELAGQVGTERARAERAEGELRGYASREAREGTQRAKGVDPPCWYRVVERADGTVRERALYLLNVAVRDRGIVLGRRSPPAGGPDDEDGDYAREFKELGGKALPYGKMLTDAQARAALAPIRERGDAGLVRSYPCKSYAQVWDLTGRSAKGRWRSAKERLVEQYLGVYVIEDLEENPWSP